LPDNFILAGHSAGSGSAVTVASYTVHNGASKYLKGIVLLDGVS
jgi:hypothetical protein